MKLTLDYLGMSDVITKVLLRGRTEGQRKKCEDGSRGQSDIRKGPLDKCVDRWL